MLDHTKQKKIGCFIVSFFIFRSSRISPFRISSWRLRKCRKTLYATLETRTNQHRSFTSFIFNPFPMQEIWQVSFYLLRIYGKIWFRVNWYTLLKLLLMNVLEAKFSLRTAWTKEKKINWLNRKIIIMLYIVVSIVPTSTHSNYV